MFLPTPPMRAVTVVIGLAPGRLVVSTHTTHEGGDLRCSVVLRQDKVSAHTTHEGGDCEIAQKKCTIDGGFAEFFDGSGKEDTG